MSQKSWKTSAATRYLRSLYSLGYAGKPPSRSRCVHACLAYSPHRSDRRDQLLRSQVVRGSIWSDFERSLGCRVAGCVVRTGVRLAATCFAMRLRLRRENASRNHDLFSATLSPVCARSMYACLHSLMDSFCVVLGVINVYYKHCINCGCGLVLGYAVNKDFEVATIFFAF